MFHLNKTIRKAAQNAVVRKQFSVKSLHEVLREQIPAKQEAMKKLKKEYGHRVLGEVTVDQCIGGGRDVCGAWWSRRVLFRRTCGQSLF